MSCELQPAPRLAGGGQDSWRPPNWWELGWSPAAVVMSPWTCSLWKGEQKTGMGLPGWSRAGRARGFPTPSPCKGLGKPKTSPWRNSVEELCPTFVPCFHGTVTLAVPPGSSRGTEHPISEMGPIRGHEVWCHQRWQGTRRRASAACLPHPFPITGLSLPWQRQKIRSRKCQGWMGDGLVLLSCFKQPLWTTVVGEGREGGVAMAKWDLLGMNSFLFLPWNEWVAKTSLHMKIVGATLGGRDGEQYPPPALSYP